MSRPFWTNNKPTPINYRHPANQHVHEGATRGERLAETMARLVGSWHFLITQNLLLLCWIVVNLLAWKLRWDPYPFILLNLVLSTQAAETGPILLIAANRSAERDRVMLEQTYADTELLKTDLRQNSEHTLYTRQQMDKQTAMLEQLLPEAEHG